MSWISKNRRPLTTLFLAFSFLANGAFLISVGLINTGGLFFYTPIVLLAYVPFFWMVERRKPTQGIEIWKTKEIWVFTAWLFLLAIGGIIESLFLEKLLFILFVCIAIALVVFWNKHLKQTSKQPYLSNVSVHFPLFFKWFAGIIAMLFIGLLVDAIRTEMTPEGQLVLLKNDNDLVEFLLGILVFVFFFFILSWLIWQLRSALRFKTEKKKTEVLHLQSQVNPHFFFNTLNNLYGLVEEDPKKAQALILKLSDMMRYSIYEGQKKWVSIVDEVAYLQNYIALHKMRYHKEITIQFTTALQNEEGTVMPLLFILLLENAFKHGVENMQQDAFVSIHLGNTKKEIHFSVENNYDPTQTSEQAGIGLKNLKRRLALVYPKKHALSFDVTDTTYKAILTLETL